MRTSIIVPLVLAALAVVTVCDTQARAVRAKIHHDSRAQKRHQDGQKNGAPVGAGTVEATVLEKSATAAPSLYLTTADSTSPPSPWTSWPSWTTEAPSNNTQCPDDIHIQKNGLAIFESPNYGHGNYSNNLHCSTWITTDPDQKMAFHPYDVDLEEGWDNLYLYDTSPSTNRLLAKITGNGQNLTWPIYSDSHSVEAIFITDGSITRRGFYFYVQSIPIGQHSSTIAPPSTSRSTSSPWSPVYPSSTLRPWNSSPRQSTWSGWNSTQRPPVAPITWTMGNTTTITQTHSSGNTIWTTVQTVTRTGTSIVVTDTVTTTKAYSLEGWGKVQKSESGFYDHKNQKIE